MIVVMKVCRQQQSSCTCIHSRFGSKRGWLSEARKNTLVNHACLVNLLLLLCHILEQMKRKESALVSGNSAVCKCGACIECIKDNVEKAFVFRDAVVSAFAWEKTS